MGFRKDFVVNISRKSLQVARSDILEFGEVNQGEGTYALVDMVSTDLELGMSDTAMVSGGTLTEEYSLFNDLNSGLANLAMTSGGELGGL